MLQFLENHVSVKHIVKGMITIMENRTEEIWATLASVIAERKERDWVQAIPVTESCKDVLLSQLSAALLSCNKQVLEWQRKGEKGDTAFIALSFLNSSVLTGEYDLRIDFYDDRFLVDTADAYAYFSYKHLMPIYQESAEAICQEADNQFVRLMDYEQDALNWKYKDEVLIPLIKSVCSYSLLHPDMADVWPQLSLTANCVLTFGGFLHDQQLYLRIPQLAGADL